MARYDPEKYGPLEPYYPHGLTSRIIAALGLAMLLAAAAFLLPDLLPRAPELSPPLWPLAGAWRLAGCWFAPPAGLLAIALFMLPYLDSSPRKPLASRPWALALVVTALAAFFLLGLWGLAGAAS
jgi:quinol-cytochrome oxidoreductase complex cytochrome b subunit